MSRLVIVSNRVPNLSGKPCTGGLAVALKGALKENGGLWFGWSGRVADSPADQPTMIGGGGFSLATVDLSPAEYRGYYEEFANRALWPAFHDRLDISRFERDAYGVYRRVNRRFATALASLLRPDDVIWVHDYHLIPLGAELRRLGVRVPVGFFLHVPFPRPEQFRAAAWGDEFGNYFCAYDLVGFQTDDCLGNFRRAVATQGRPADSGRVAAGQNRAALPAAGAFPVGIDTAAFRALARSPAVRRKVDGLRASFPGRTWLAGVERLDYTKGLIERCRAFETLLEESPSLHGRVSFLQVAAPSRESIPEYRELRQRLDGLTRRINDRFGTERWTPLIYFNRSFSHPQLAAFYRLSRVGLVTPLRDGMNIVAKEFVAAQDADDPGVLVLSRFAGAARELTDALIVDPRDTAAMARAMGEALAMPLDERRARWRRAMAHLETHDLTLWRRTFLSALLATRGRAAATVEAA